MKHGPCCLRSGDLPSPLMAIFPMRVASFGLCILTKTLNAIFCDVIVELKF